MASKRKIFTTGIGTVEPYASLHKPDYGNAEKGFGNPRGIWKVDITLPAKAAQPYMDQIVKAHEANYAALVEQFEKDRPELLKKLGRGKKLLEPYEGDMPFFENDDGTVTFRLKGYASYLKDGKNIDIPLRVVDSMGKRIENVPIIGGGSKGKARFSMVPYGWTNVAGASVKLQIEGFMLTELAEFGGGDDWGDEVVEGGYAAGEREDAGWSGSEEEDYQGDDDNDPPPHSGAGADF